MARVIEARRRQREDWLKLARAYADRLKQRTGQLTAIVYGSVARGDFNLGSDVGILIVTAGLPSHPLRRMELLYSLVEPPLEPKGYTPSEFRALLAKRHPTIREALVEGIVIWDELGLTRAAQTHTTSQGGFDDEDH